MKDLIVCMTATETAVMMPQYLQQLSNAGIDYNVEKTQVPVKDLISLGVRIPRARKLAEEFKDYKYIIISDAYDVFFLGTKDHVLEMMPEHAVMLSAERNCFPDPSLVDKIKGPTPWKYANGGLLAGTPKEIDWWAKIIQAHPLYRDNYDDQTFFNTLLFLYGKIPGTFIDYRTTLFYSLYGESNELQFHKGIPVNTLTGTHPAFIHANGKWPCGEIWYRHDSSLGQVEPVELMPIKIPFTSHMQIDVCRKCRDRLLAMNMGFGG